MEKEIMLRNLSHTQHDTFKKCATIEDIQRFAQLDVDLAQNIANNIDSCDQIDPQVISLSYLMNSTDVILVL
jgi:spore coat protein CotF